MPRVINQAFVALACLTVRPAPSECNPLLVAVVKDTCDWPATSAPSRAACARESESPTLWVLPDESPQPETGERPREASTGLEVQAPADPNRAFTNG
jgi:hypothetical protein